jgi:hypothetical protein
VNSSKAEAVLERSREIAPIIDGPRKRSARGYLGPSAFDEVG